MTGSTFGDRLVGEGVLTAEQVRKAVEMQHMLGGRLGTNLLELGYLGERALLDHLGRFRSMTVVDPADLQKIPSAVLRSVPPKLVRRYGLLPYQVRGKTLLVASKDPGDPLHEDEISFMTGFMVRTHLALELHLDVALRRFYKAPLGQRFVALTRRLAAAGSGPAATSGAPSSAPRPAVPPVPSPSAPVAPAPPTPQTPTPQTPTGAAPAPAAPVAKSAEPDMEFIELDASDLALLRGGPSVDLADNPAVPAASVAPLPTPPPAPFLPDENLSTDPSDEPATDPMADEDDDPMPTDGDQEALAAWAGRRLQGAEIRDEIGDVLLAVGTAGYRRAALVIRRKDELMGWMASGDGAPEDFRSLRWQATAPSVFFGLQTADSFWLGPLPPLPANRQLVEALGGEAPRDCLVLPISLRSKIVGYLYVDNLEAGVAGSPVAEMKRLVAKAGLAFEIYILRNKIRMM